MGIMNILTKYHGEIEINPKDIIQFDKGIPGFANEHQFIFLEFANNGSFHILQSIQHPDIGFFIVNPFEFFLDYQFELDKVVIEELQLDQSKEHSMQVAVILTPQEPFEKTTANLQAPIIINLLNNKAKQVILNDQAFSVKQSLFTKQVAHQKG